MTTPAPVDCARLSRAYVGASDSIHPQVINASGCGVRVLQLPIDMQWRSECHSPIGGIPCHQKALGLVKRFAKACYGSSHCGCSDSPERSYSRYRSILWSLPQCTTRPFSGLGARSAWAIEKQAARGYQ